MRPIYITLPIGALFACVGTMMWMKSHAVPSQMEKSNEPTHPVTQQMNKATLAKSEKDAPSFTLKDSAGKEHTLESLSKDKPVFLYFILDKCPCSIEVEPLFHALHEQHGKAINFVGIISSNEKTALEWAKNHKTPYPVLADPEEVTMSSYEAPSSAYAALVVDGKIKKMWPGYSKSILLDMNEKMASAAGKSAPTFDTQYAPLKDSTGCSFDWVAEKKS